MSLGQKLILLNVALVLGLVALCAALLWGLRGLSVTVDEAVAEYRELRTIEESLLHASSARDAIAAGEFALNDPRVELRLAMTAVSRFKAFQFEELVASAEHQSDEARLVGEAIAGLDDGLAALDAGTEAVALKRLDAATRSLSALARTTDVSGAVDAAASRVARTIGIVSIAAASLVAGAASASIVGYRLIMQPLRRLRNGVRTLASGRFGERLPPERDPEFAALATDFNRMAAELESLYHDLEAKVARKSSELARSERLASVGFLAAGVAHEINNPLGVVSGYAELCRKWFADGAGPPPPALLADARHAMTVIAEEAARCKQITHKLLSMSRMDDGPRESVALSSIARELVTTLEGLPQQRGVAIELRADPDADTRVVVNAAEIRQVALNLIANALQSMSGTRRGGTSNGQDASPRGRILVLVHRRESSVELVVEDDGCGMSPEVLERIFEPFFTAREAQHAAGEPSARRGVGLGLSISHAIVASHAGSLRASSDGVGRGSRFVLSLPAAPAPSMAPEPDHVTTSA